MISNTVYVTEGSSFPTKSPYVGFQFLRLDWGILFYATKEGAVTASDWKPIIATNLSQRNYLINGDFSVWQRGTSSGVQAGAYGSFLADHWKWYWDGSSGGSTFASRVNQAAGNGGDNYAGTGAPYWGYEPGYIMQYNRGAVPSGATIATLIQYMEDVRILAGKTVTYSFWAYIDTATNAGLSFILANNYGPGGSAQSVPVGLTNIPNLAIGAWKRYTATFTVTNQLGGKTIGAQSSLELQLRINPNYVGNMYFTGFQLQEGASATPFIKEDPTDTLRKCHRYYQKSWQLSTNPGTVTDVGRVLTQLAAPSSGFYYFTVKLNAPMAVPYSAQVYNNVSGAAGQIYNYTRGTGSTAVAFTGNGSENSFEFNATPPAGWAEGDLVGFHWIAYYE